MLLVFIEKCRIIFSINPFTISDADAVIDKNAFNCTSWSTVLNNVELDDNENTIIDILKWFHNDIVYIRVDSVNNVDSIQQVSDGDTFF